MPTETVVVTGFGVAVSRFLDPYELFDVLAEGQTLLVPVEAFASQDVFSPYGCPLDSETARSILERSSTGGGGGLQIEMAVESCQQALAMAGLDAGKGGRRGTFVGANRNTFSEQDLLAASACLHSEGHVVDFEALRAQAAPDAGSAFVRSSERTALHVARTAGFMDHVSNHGDACAAGAIAVATAFRFIQDGLLDVAVAGASDALCHLVPCLGFAAVGTICGASMNDSAPSLRSFDRRREGFVLGEGAAFLVLESRSRAIARGARILGELAGAGVTSESGALASSAPDGSAFARCMRDAITDAGIGPEDVGHISAHGTGTIANDRCEARAIRSVFGAANPNVPITATKSSLGHAFGCSGVLEIVLSLISLEKGVLLPIAGFDEPEEEFSELEFLRESRAEQVDVVLSNSFGLGGQNASLVLRRWEAPRCVR